MRFVGFTNLKNSSTALCSIAWLKYPDQVVDTSYVAPHNCTNAGFDLTTPHDYPPKQRTLNPPGLNFTDWEERLKYPEWKNPSLSGSIYPLDMRAKMKVDTSNVVSNQTIEFSPSTSFNGIRTNWSDVPYLLQHPANTTKRCNFANKDDHQFIKLTGPDATTVSVCQHVLNFPFDPEGWVEIILINNGKFPPEIAHPIHQHGGWYWVVGGGKYNHSIDRTFVEAHLKYTGSSFSLLKDVIQVPFRGYVILRTRLDNPGTFIFHCHIDFHLSIGMGLVLQIGDQGDWNNGPLKKNNQELNKVCEEKPPSPIPSKLVLSIHYFLLYLFFLSKGIDCLVFQHEASSEMHPKR